MHVTIVHISHHQYAFSLFLPAILIHIWLDIDVVHALGHGTIVHDDTKDSSRNESNVPSDTVGSLLPE